MSFHLTLDPPAAISSRVELDLNSGPIQTTNAGVDFGESAVKQYLSEQQYGESAVSYRVPNRVISIPLLVGAVAGGSVQEEEEARRDLNEKTALLQRQGGVLLRQQQLEHPVQNLVLNPSGTGLLKTYLTSGAAGAVTAGATLATLIEKTPIPGTSALFTYTQVTCPEGLERGIAIPLQGPFLKGVTYSLTVRLYSEIAGNNVSVFLMPTSGEGGLPVSASGASWKSYTVTLTPTKEEAVMWLVARKGNNAAGIFYITAEIAIVGAVPPTYFDGNTFACHWSGVLGESVSETGGEPLYADIVTASLTLPDVYGETGGVEPNTVLKLECLPDFYGEEITLDTVEQTGQIDQVLQRGGKQAVIAGDYPARTRIILTEKSKNDQKGLLWGLRSTHYDSDPSAALFFDANALTAINGATKVAAAEAYSGKAVQIDEGLTVGVWHPFMTTDLAAGEDQLTHVGSYRIWARCFIGNGGSLRLAWSAGDATVGTYNKAVTVSAGYGWYLLDLGEVHIAEVPVGEHWWRGVFQFDVGPKLLESEVPGIQVDRVWLQPVDDGAGRLRAPETPSSTLLAPHNEPSLAESSNALHAGTAWLNATNVEKGHPGNAATVNPAIHAESAALAVKGFGFNLAPEAIVKGITVAVVAEASASESPVVNLYVQLLKAGALAGGTISTFWTGFVTQHLSLGGTTNMWGTTWTPAQINAANFGVALHVLNEVAGDFIAVYTVTVTVYYSYSETGVPDDAVLYSERTSEIRFDGGFREDTTTGAYVGVSQLLGDLPRLPPSGLEGRAVELLVKNTRGLLDPNVVDPGIDKISAVVKYRPCYIGRL